MKTYDIFIQFNDIVLTIYEIFIFLVSKTMNFFQNGFHKILQIIITLILFLHQFFLCFQDPSESSLNGSFSFSIGTGMAELERMKSREPIIFSQMSVNILRYIATDLPGDVIKGLLTYRSGDPCLTSVTSASSSSSDDLDCDLSVEWPQIFSWDSQYSNVNLLIKYLENCEYV